MSKPSRFTLVKVTAGYILLLSIIIFSLFFINREIQNLSVLDTEQILKTDSLMFLLREKDENTINMLRELNEANERLLSVKDLEEIIARQDTVITQQRVQHKVVTSRDSIVTPVKKKGFFRRLGEVFVPKKDTAKVVSTTMEFTTDTLLNEYNPADSLQEQILQVSKQKKNTHRSTIRRNNARMKEMNELLTARIDSLIQDYQEEILIQATQEAENQQEIRRRSTETIVWIAMGAILLSAVFLIIILRDITRSDRYRRQLEIANKRAEELLQARENLMLTISHDFKAPLSSIIGYIDLLSEPDADTDSRKEYLVNMKSSSDHLLKLVTDLLDFHRLDLNKAEVNRVTFNPAQLFDEIKISFEPLIQNKGLAFNYDIAPILDGAYISDPHRIRQIVNNLLSNAIKFTPDGSITLSVKYDSSRLIISITDTGKGMAAADKERIFQEFTRLSGAQGQEGFGLGLSIVKKLIHLLEGTIEVDSTQGEGSTFTARLPLFPVIGGGKITEKPENKDEKIVEAPPLHVLLIDDDKIQLNLTSAMLARAGITTVCCEQLDQLIEHLRNQTFDVLLTDVQMPAMSGFDLLKLLRASNIPQAQAIPVIAVTARSEINGEQYKQHGFAGYLNKPFTATELLNILSGYEPEVKEDSAPLPETDKIDFSGLTQFAVGDVEKEREILENFMEQTNNNLKTLREALQNEDVNTIAFISHKFIPLLKLIGAKNTVNTLQKLEIATGKEFNADIRIYTQKAIDDIQALYNKLPMHK